MGGNLFFASTGAVLEIVGESVDDALIAAWRSRVERACSSLHWHSPHAVVRRHAGGASLAMTAPYDQLLLATEVNEWAVCAALAELHPSRSVALEQALVAQALEAAENSGEPGAYIPPALEESAAIARFARLSEWEARPTLQRLLDAAAGRGLSYVVDETQLTLGAGVGGRSFFLAALPEVADLPWQALHNIPTALVTGSNGKTTTVRLLAACARAHGWRAGYNCTDGVFLDDEALATGDYSGPAGARSVIREPRAQAAILETARGGILRRGIAVSRADTAIVTNISPDHFGEYGIHDLEGLTDVKLAVAATLDDRGLLVLNADDARLRAHAQQLTQRFGRCPPLGWFSSNPDRQSLQVYESLGAPTCGVRQGRLHLSYGGEQHDLGVIASMPLSMAGIAAYNIANLAGAALCAAALGIAIPAIREVLGRFGANRGDNPGRMMRFAVRGITVLIDYAHNPDGLRGFLQVADHLRSSGSRLGLLLGQAGNRNDSDIEELAQVAAGFSPDLVVVKEDEAHLRGRAPAEVPRIIRAELMRLGMPEAALPVVTSEIEAVRYALTWARPGDVLALPVHSSIARAEVIALLETG